ncbi:MAG: protein kinase family protein [Microthrixaceae bacterium]
MSDPDPGGFAHLSDDHEPAVGAGDEWVEWVELSDGPASEADDGDAPDDDEDGNGDDALEFTYEATLAPDDPGMAELLERGEMEVLGLMPWSSNGTYLVRLERGSDHAPAIYKPERGERPLWDFPGALWKREVASYELSSALGVDLVPTTVARVAAPIGRGSVQAFVPARFAEHYFTLRERPELGPSLRALCAFDLIANSADRKGGHCLVDDDGRIWAIDNGLTFHAEFKVRTVIWDFAGEALPRAVAEAVAGLLDDGVPPSLCELLTRDEQAAMMDRARALLAGGHFPHDPTGRRYPWPLV